MFNEYDFDGLIVGLFHSLSVDLRGPDSWLLTC